MTLGDRIRAFRESLKLKQGEMANKMSVSQTSLSFWENDKVIPDGTALKRLCELGADLHWILTGKNHISNGANSDGSINFDSNLLAEIIIIVENALSERNLKISSTKKAQLITEMYKYCVVSDQVPATDSFAKLLKMA